MLAAARNWYRYSAKKIKRLTRISSKEKRRGDQHDEMSHSDNKKPCLQSERPQSLNEKEHQAGNKEVGPIDPISLEVIDPNRITILNGNCYDHVTLIQYFTSTLNFRDPLTMALLTEDQVIELDMKSFSFMMHLNDRKEAMKEASESAPRVIEHEVKAVAVALDIWPFIHEARAAARMLAPPSPLYPPPKPVEKTNLDLQLPSLLPLYRKQAADVIRKKSHMSTIHTLESICGGLVEEIYDLIEQDGKEEDKEFNFFFLRIVSDFDCAWRELKSMDPQAAYLALQSYKNFLTGSAKKPTPDPRHRLRYVLMVLDNALWTSDDNTRHINDRKARSQSYDVQSASEMSDASPALSPRSRTQSMT